MKIADLSWCGEVWQLRDGGAENLLLSSTLLGTPKSSTHRMIDKNSARRRDMGHDVQSRSNNQRRNVMAFDDMGDETDGLMAERSVWYQ